MTGRADHQCFFMLGAKLGNRPGDLVKAKVNDYVGLLDYPGQVVGDVDPRNDLDVRIGLAAAEQRFTHSTLGSVDDDFGHGGYFLSTPQALSVLANCARLAADILQSGRRYSSAHLPSMAKAAFAGTGFVSMNKSLNIG